VLEYLGPISEGIAATVTITALAFVLGSILGLPLLAASRSPWLPVRALARFLIDLLRAVPPIVWLFILFFGLAQSLVSLDAYPAAVIGFGCISAAYMAEIYRAGLLAVRRQQWEAGAALGLNRLQVLRTIVGPQAIRVVIPGAATWAIALLKETAVVSVIGVSDVTFLATSESQRSGDGLLIFLLAGGIYILMSLPLALVARWTDARLHRAVAL